MRRPELTDEERKKNRIKYQREYRERKRIEKQKQERERERERERYLREFKRAKAEGREAMFANQRQEESIDKFLKAAHKAGKTYAQAQVEETCSVYQRDIRDRRKA